MNPYYEDEFGKLYCGDTMQVASELEDNLVDMIVTSPPYWAQRNYLQNEDQLGQEPYFKDYIKRLTEYFFSLAHVMKDDGTLWVNIGDTIYGSSKGSTKSNNKNNKGSFQQHNAKRFMNKELPHRSQCMVPARFAIEMQDTGWFLGCQMIWHKPNGMPGPNWNRFQIDYEPVYLFAKHNKYKFNTQYEPAKEDSIRRMKSGWNGNIRDGDVAQSGMTQYMGSPQAIEHITTKGRIKRAVWSINTESKKGLKHYATFPFELVRTPILAGSNEGDIVLDPFMGSGQTAIECERLGRKWIGIELNEEYCDEAIQRILDYRNKETVNGC